ncbi:GPI-anchor transamidase [Pneumocystis jirovecii RU7]|uniref:GPI-anchor transamidase n=1 Tax=Pneumocystis jirovecii (strain RU7) TaxID=1408657 RepID=A0A0W4ZVQ7_PNEJ7|nr:GPI-anchor transamidase [Pneumocystis jirovecii RU7]KTW32456.1 hypothetical protein T551_00546 [Pneumocystis jirovecii RU7]
MYFHRIWAFITFIILLKGISAANKQENPKELPYKNSYTSNWAVLVSTSRFWFNYRHMANALGMYRTIKRLGIPDSQIILMLSDDIACNSRNAFPGTVFHNADRVLDLYGKDIEVDYRGYEVTVENFIRLLTGRVSPNTPRSKQLLTDERSNIFIYMTGHGGDNFLKFQDSEEICSHDIADAFQQMWEKKRYHEILFMIDTCQANTMYSKFYSPNVLAIGSSELNESSYSHHSDHDIGVSVIDRFTYYTLDFLEKNVNITSKHTFKELFNSYDKNLIQSTPGIKTDLFRRNISDVKITDFLGNVRNTEINQEDQKLELGKEFIKIEESYHYFKTKSDPNLNLKEKTHFSKLEKAIHLKSLERKTKYKIIGINIVCISICVLVCRF